MFNWVHNYPSLFRSSGFAASILIYSQKVPIRPLASDTQYDRCDIGKQHITCKSKKVLCSCKQIIIVIDRRSCNTHSFLHYFVCQKTFMHCFYLLTKMVIPHIVYALRTMPNELPTNKLIYEQDEMHVNNGSSP